MDIWINRAKYILSRFAFAKTCFWMKCKTEPVVLRFGKSGKQKLKFVTPVMQLLDATHLNHKTDLPALQKSGWSRDASKSCTTVQTETVQVWQSQIYVKEKSTKSRKLTSWGLFSWFICGLCRKDSLPLQGICCLFDCGERNLQNPKANKRFSSFYLKVTVRIMNENWSCKSTGSAHWLGDLMFAAAQGEGQRCVIYHLIVVNSRPTWCLLTAEQ